MNIMGMSLHTALYAEKENPITLPTTIPNIELDSTNTSASYINTATILPFLTPVALSTVISCL